MGSEGKMTAGPGLGSATGSVIPEEPGRTAVPASAFSTGHSLSDFPLSQT